MNIKMRYLTIIAVGILLAANPAVSDPVAGAGAQSCGTFLATVEAGGKMASLFYRSWALGYLTGLNTKYVLCQEHFSTDLSDVEGIKLWIKNYCEENPLDEYLMAVTKLWEALRVKQKIQSIYECP